MRDLSREFAAMAKKQKLAIRLEIRDVALEVYERWGNNPQVRRKVKALIRGLDDTLEDAVVLRELTAVLAYGMSFLVEYAASRN